MAAVKKACMGTTVDMKQEKLECESLWTDWLFESVHSISMLACFCTMLEGHIKFPFRVLKKWEDCTFTKIFRNP